ncbi:hypothetical protein MHM93_01595 [Pseudoalteromonas sp. MM17-2]|uniref:hypothetical protein n=1 Tax=Pseudoalteromonas sp. MM17-2 TaxID=2917753 RepID=UPI001EF59CD6|nr:hypothetical protein [Pseudoalteromonas sp. MM17-2]MCG7542873.1 hypothetical protein [Pseudoalteromonas sp. MM17-2]
MSNLIQDGVVNAIVKDISDSLDQVGLMYRIFQRVKTKESLDKKISRDSEYGKSKRIQDLVGIRVVLYFADDISIAHRIISGIYSERSKDNSIDSYNESQFKPVRYNLVYDFPPDSHISIANDFEAYIDHTFELQIRSVLSEGWHEVEHDFRYKCADDWCSHQDKSRKLNGIYASLETNEWTMIKIFDEISYGHYKGSSWDAMIRHKFRLRFKSEKLDSDVVSVFDDDISVAKQFFRLDREQLIMELQRYNFPFPITLSNLIFFANEVLVKNDRLSEIVPQMLKDEL